MITRSTIMTAALVAAVAVSGPVAAQRESLAERVARLEQELRESGGNESRQTLTDLVYQLNDLQAEIRELRGLVEDQAFEIENLRSSQQDQYLDLDRRLGEIAGGAPAGTAATPRYVGTPPAGATSAGVDGGFDRPRRVTREPVTTTVDDGAVVTTPVPSGPAGDFPEVRDPIDADLQTTGLAEPTAGPITAMADPVAEKAAYDEAFDALKNGRYSDASRQFGSFVQQYPASEYADNAQYWLGESYYVTRNYRVALDSFQRLLSQFPDSAKAPDARLKIGLSYYSLQNWEAAERELEAVVAQYPDSTVSRLAQNRLRTMRIEGYID